jgi:hypothetical protein
MIWSTYTRPHQSQKIYWLVGSVSEGCWLQICNGETNTVRCCGPEYDMKNHLFTCLMDQEGVKSVNLQDTIRAR